MKKTIGQQCFQSRMRNMTERKSCLAFSSDKVCLPLVIVTWALPIPKVRLHERVDHVLMPGLEHQRLPRVFIRLWHPLDAVDVHHSYWVGIVSMEFEV